MASKVLLCVLLISLIAFSSAQQTCLLSTLLTSLCLNNVCTLDASTILLLCGVPNLSALVNPLLNITLPSSATININTGTNVNFGYLTISSSTSATATVNLAAATQIANDIVISGATLLNVAEGVVVHVGGKLQVAAESTVNIAGNLTVAGATFIYGTIHFGGSVVASAAQTAWLVATTTTVTVQGSATASAVISGNGGFDSSVVLSGNVTVAAGNSPGVVYVNGDFTMSSTSTLEIEVDSATSFDQMIIGGRFNRAGILHANFESYTPPNGQIFLFATHSSDNGKFSISRGNFDATLNKVHPKYASLSTSFEYGSAATVALPIALMALCLLGLVF